MVVMARTLCGRSVHPIGLGCMNLSWAYSDPPEPAEKVRLLNEALDLGYDHLDTANIYGRGKNEELLCEAVMHRRDEFLLTSKTGIIVDGARRGIDCSPADDDDLCNCSSSYCGLPSVTDNADDFFIQNKSYEDSTSDLSFGS